MTTTGRVYDEAKHLPAIIPTDNQVWITMVRPFLLSLALLSGSFPIVSLSAEQLTVLAIEYPPYTSAKALAGGTAFDLLREQLSASGLEVRPQFVPPARASYYLERGQWCASFYPPAVMQTNIEIHRLSEQGVRLGLFRRQQPEAFSWQRLAELDGRRVAILRRSGTHSLLLDQLREAGLVAVFTESVLQGFRMLSEGRVDLVFGDQLSGQHAIREAGLDGSQFQFSEAALLTVPLQIFINSDCPPARVAAEHLTAFRLSEQETPAAGTAD